MQQPSPAPRLRETIVKASAKAADWSTLEGHLNTLVLTGAIADELMGHIRRCNELIVRYPDQKRQAKCDAFFQSLKTYLENKLGPEQATRVTDTALEFGRIGAGYREILVTLARAPVSALSAEKRVAAGIVWSARTIHDFIRHGRQLAEGLAMRVVTQGGLLRGPSGEIFASDAIVTALVEGVTKSIIMEARRHGWTDDEGNIVFPDDGIVTPTDVEIAEPFILLAMCWRRWEHVEQALRYLGGQLEEYKAPDIPPHEQADYAVQHIDPVPVVKFFQRHRSLDD